MKFPLYITSVIISFLIPFLAKSQSLTYEIQGKVGNENAPAKAFLVYSKGTSYQIDSLFLTTGSFMFRGSVENPLKATLILDHSGIDLGKMDASQPADVLELYLEPGITKVNGKDSLFRALVTGGPMNADNSRFQKLQQPLQMEMKNLLQQTRTLSAEKQKSPEFQADAESRYNKIVQENLSLVQKFALDNPSSAVSLDLLVSSYASQPDPSGAEGAFSKLDKKLKETPLGLKFASMLSASRLTAIGSMAPDFTQADTSGKQVSLSSFRGKYLLIDFWASWCRPCRLENPNVVRVFDKYKNKKFMVMGISLDRADDKASWLQAIKDDHLNWVQVSDLRFWQNAVARAYGIKSIPQNFLLDPQGKIIAKGLRGEQLDQTLAELLK